MLSKSEKGDSKALVLNALRWSSLFGKWPLDNITKLASIARLEHYRRGTQVLAEEPQRREVLVVVSGCLEVSHVNATGKKFTLNLIAPGLVVALVRLLEGDMHMPFEYYAHEPTVLVHLPCEALLAILDADPVRWREVAQLALRRQHNSLLLLQYQALATPLQRLASLLIDMYDLHGAPDQAVNTSLQLLRLPQNQLASMLGVSRQTMSKALHTLKDAALIQTDYRHVIVLDIEGLRQLAACNL